jgi:release factor glutamine methyltransferase
MSMPTVGQALRAAAERLSATSDTARLDAEVLMAHALDVSRSEMLLRHMTAAEPASFAAMVERRLSHEPVAYVTGVQEFYGLEFRVSPAVLIPRGDSETLIDAAQAAFAAHGPGRVLDLGTGSGALLLAALSIWPTALGVGIDRSPEALGVAQTNADALGLAARTQLLQIDWTLPDWDAAIGTFDLVLANPPYVESSAALDASVASHEPHGALFAGDDGLDDYRRLIPRLPGLLTPKGVAMVEIGWTQADAVSALAQKARLHSVLHRDLGDRPRALELRAL